jgi:hypothetical protein
MDTLNIKWPHNPFNFQGPRKERNMDWPLLLIIGNSNVKKICSGCIKMFHVDYI